MSVMYLQVRTTDLSIFKVIIYRILQLPQFLFLFLLFFFLLLRQSGLSLVIIILVLVYLWCEGNKTQQGVKGPGDQTSDYRAPHDSQHATDTGAPGVFTWEIHVLVTAYLRST